MESEMKTARCLIEVTAGILPGKVEPELTRVYAVASEEWNATDGDGAKRGELLAGINGKAQGYASWLMLQPDRLNWVRTDWLWL
jgi:hypothetical protein